MQNNLLMEKLTSHGGKAKPFSVLVNFKIARKQLYNFSTFEIFLQETHPVHLLAVEIKTIFIHWENEVLKHVIMEELSHM